MVGELVLQAPALVIAQALGYHDKSTTRSGAAGGPRARRRGRARRWTVGELAGDLDAVLSQLSPPKGWNTPA
ncbi:hypothetical protein AB0I54_43630 [Streptomyces sp. NPDC050625]|uniref:hypothetical protein n=1 Tax=Streptomyces sp. NPDC050625 TaxID=3154629 RepID=UPI0034146D43